jgi:hypothetical protein
MAWKINEGKKKYLDSNQYELRRDDGRRGGVREVEGEGGRLTHRNIARKANKNTFSREAVYTLPKGPFTGSFVCV